MANYSNYGNGYYIGGPKYSPRSKNVNALNMKTYMLDRTRRMFKHNNLPGDVRERELELILQQNGHVFITEVNGTLYALTGNLGGNPDAYGIPTEYIVANPYLNVSKTYKIGVDGILMLNDSTMRGISNIIDKYCVLMSENQLSMHKSIVMSRAALVFTAEDGKDKKSAEGYVRDLEAGDLSIITSNSWMKDITVQPGATGAAQNLTNLIEMEQYLKASLFNELGLNSNWNAKRESITSSESLLNTDALFPLCDDMLECRKDAIEKVNEMFGTNWTVEFASSWGRNALQEEMKEVQMEQAIEGEEVEEESDLEVEDNPQEIEEIEQEEKEDKEEEQEDKEDDDDDKKEK